MAHSRVGVKVCGVTSIEDARACAEAGADWIGLNFHPASPRCVEPERAAEIVAALAGSVAAVGVFADRSAALVAEIAARVGIEIVQLHGREPVEDVRALYHLRVIKAFPLQGPSAWANVADYLERVHASGCSLEAVLVDAHCAGLAGGTGTLIPDEIFEHAPPLPRLILAGGLTPENVAARVARVRPWMVDVASGVESTPGKKDLRKVAAFIGAVRGALAGD